MYKIITIDFNKTPKMTPDEYNAAVNNAVGVYVTTFAKVVKYLGFTPHRTRVGYFASIGNIDYIILKENKKHD